MGERETLAQLLIARVEDGKGNLDTWEPGKAHLTADHDSERNGTAGFPVTPDAHVPYFRSTLRLS